MLHETIRNDDFKRNTVLQHCCDIVSHGYNIAPTLQRCVSQAKNRRCESSRVTSPLLVPQSWFTGIEDSLMLAADELFNLQAGARPEATKLLIVFSDRHA